MQHRLHRTTNHGTMRICKLGEFFVGLGTMNTTDRSVAPMVLRHSLAREQQPVPIGWQSSTMRFDTPKHHLEVIKIDSNHHILQLTDIIFSNQIADLFTKCKYTVKIKYG